MLASANAWGSVNMNEPTKEQVDEMRKLQWMNHARNKLRDPKVHPQEKKNLANYMTLAEKHDFWDTQPVMRFLQPHPEKDAPIDKNESIDKVQKEPFTLPDGFEWVTLDIASDKDAEMIYRLLREHYVEDADGTFRFDYPVALIRWVLQIPGYIKDWHIGVKAVGKDNLLAFVSGTPRKLNVNDHSLKVSCINFLCVHKKLRAKKLAPVLIKEVTRRCNLAGVWQAYYTSGTTVPHPFAQAQYFHRSLNPKKLCEVGFSELPKSMPLARYVKLNALDSVSKLVGNLRPMEKKDISQVYALYKKQFESLKFTFKFSQEELAHQLMPQEGVIYTIVVENSGKVTDFVSFYNLPNQVLKQVGHSHTNLNVSY